MPDVARRTAEAVVRDGARRLDAFDGGTARREAGLLWGAVAGHASLGAVWLDADRPATPEQEAAFTRLVARRVAGEPLAYVTGRAGFRTLDLMVDPRVLIPRPETEGLVERVLAHARSRGRWGRVVDVGTGSGCIALSLAREGSFRDVVATDVSPDALAVARANAAAVGLADRVAFRRGDLLEACGDGGYDAIVSNPPYVTPAEHAALDAGVRDFEPRLALVADGDGLGPTRALLDGAGRVLREGGLLAIEVDSNRAGRALAHAEAGAWSAAWVERDLFGRPRYLLVMK